MNAEARIVGIRGERCRGAAQQEGESDGSGGLRRAVPLVPRDRVHPPPQRPGREKASRRTRMYDG